MIYLLRGAYANEFELQNYTGIAKSLDLKVVTSRHPLTRLSLPSFVLDSPVDLPNIPFKRQILNRAIGGEQWLVGLEKLVEERSHDLNHEIIIHTAETYYPYAHQAVELRKQGKIAKLVCTCWETIPHNNEKFARLKQWKREAYQYVDVFHTPTELAKQALVTEGVDPAKIVVIPYGVDLSRFKSVKHKKNARPLILTVARLEEEKGMSDLEYVAQMLPQFDFLIVGSGSRKPRGKNIRVKQVPYSQIHKVYQSADLFFLPSRTTPTWEEQYGMALVEAMACGLPIVATSSGAIPEVVGQGGTFVKAKDVRAMAETIDGLLFYGCANIQLSRASIARVKKIYDAKKVAEKLAKLYR